MAVGGASSNCRSAFCRRKRDEKQQQSPGGFAPEQEQERKQAIDGVIDDPIEVIGTAGSTGSGKIPSSAGSIAMGGGITIDSGLTATIVNCWFSDNAVTGGAGGGGAPGGAGVGGGLSVGFYPYPGFYAIGKSSTVTISGTTITRNQAIGGAQGGQGMGGGYAVGTGILFGIRDTSSVTVTGASVVTNNLPDDVFQF